jgi:hypothetical protein
VSKDGARVVQGWCKGGARVVQGWCKGGARVVQGWCKGKTLRYNRRQVTWERHTINLDLKRPRDKSNGHQKQWRILFLLPYFISWHFGGLCYGKDSDRQVVRRSWNMSSSHGGAQHISVNIDAITY